MTDSNLKKTMSYFSFSLLDQCSQALFISILKHTCLPKLTLIDHSMKRKLTFYYNKVKPCFIGTDLYTISMKYVF